MNSPKTAAELLDQYYLDMRCHALEFAAVLDRIDAAGGAANDPRLQRLLQAAAIATDATGKDRVRRFLELLSVE